MTENHNGNGIVLFRDISISLEKNYQQCINRVHLVKNVIASIAVTAPIKNERYNQNTPLLHSIKYKMTLLMPLNTYSCLWDFFQKTGVKIVK